jgi:hypothetical protein
MPKTGKNDQPIRDELPNTLQRSEPKAQGTFAKALDSAAQEYVAYSALKHTHEKVGDHWEPKERYGPSDDQAAGGRDTELPTAGGVDARASKRHLQELAQRLEIRSRSTMTKAELVGAIQKANDRQTAASRADSRAQGS